MNEFDETQRIFLAAQMMQGFIASGSERSPRELAATSVLYADYLLDAIQDQPRNLTEVK